MNFSKNTEEKLGLCSFCGRKFAPHEFFLPEQALERSGSTPSGQTCAICVRCLQRGKSLLENRMQLELSELMLQELAENLPEPQGIHRLLDEYVIGQEHAKKVLSVAVYSHYKRLSAGLKKRVEVGTEKVAGEYDEVELDKSNILLVGPTGCGKTLLASTLARIVNVPFAIADATTLTEAGYVGDDVENILLRLVQSANYNLRWAEKGIIFLDELDKIGRKSENASITRDVSGEGVQQALLKIIEGTTSTVPLQGGRKHPQSQTITINTKNILFICGGAFNGLDEIVSERLGTKEIGFKQKTPFSGQDVARVKSTLDSNNIKSNNDRLPDLKGNIELENPMKQGILPDDLTRFGLIPELVGRLPVVCKLEELVGEALIEILKKPKNALVKQYKKMLSFEDISLEIDDTAYIKLAEAASKMKTGARGLRSIMEEIMLDVIYCAPKHRGKKVKLTEETLASKEFFSQ